MRVARFFNSVNVHKLKSVYVLVNNSFVSLEKGQSVYLVVKANIGIIVNV